MSELIIAIGLVFFIEGTIYTLFPELMQRAMREMLTQPPSVLRFGGLVAVGIGFVIVWLGYR